MRVNGLILAAGMSKRMQQFKPLMKIGTRTMIELAADRMLEAQVRQVTVVLGYRGEEIRDVLLASGSRKGRVHFTCNPDYEHTHMLDSVKAGLNSMEPCDWFFAAPGDMPAISAATYRKLRKKAEGSSAKVIFPVLDGYRKHPPLISWSCRNDILQFQGKGLRELWKEYAGQIQEVPLDDPGCAMDVDDQADYQNVCLYMRRECAAGKVIRRIFAEDSEDFPESLRGFI